MKSVFSLLLALTALPAFAKPVEDGSSFSGNYLAQDQSCEKGEFSYVTGKTILIPNYTFEGTPEGLKVDGGLIPLQTMQMIDHGQGISTGASAQYLSSNEFTDTFIQINQGKKTVSVDDYKMETPDELVKTTTITTEEGQPAVTTCYFLRTF